jgi:apolipoprotein N-acyltransferase
VLLWLAFAPADVWWAGVLGVATLVLVVRGRTVVGAALLGYAAGVVFYLPLLSWVGEAVGRLPWWVLGAACGLWLAILGSLLALVQRLRWWPVAVPAVWVGLEAIAARWPFGGFPWGRLGFGQTDGPLLDLASLGGSPLVSFATALAGTLLAAAVTVPGVRGRAAALAAAVTVLAVGGLAPGWLGSTDLRQPGGTATVAIVQGNVPQLGLEFNDRAYAVLENHVEATEQLAEQVRAGEAPQPDFVLWPENSVDVDPFTHERSRLLLDRAAAAIGVPLVVGAILDGPGEEERRNASIVWDPVAGAGEVYVKRKPAPFSEYIPLRPLAERISDKTDLVRRDMVAGDEPGVLTAGPAVLGVTICYELAFDELVRDVVRGGAQVLALQNNSATFGFTAESAQQLAQAQLRAVEHGRTALASTTSGISAVVVPDGTVEQRTEIFTAETLITEVPLLESRTVATRVGSWPEGALAALGVVALLLAVLRSRSGRGTQR